MPLPTPEIGLVVHFNYLWGREHRLGRENARYPRPCAIVLLSRSEADGKITVMVAPVTHSPPTAADDALEMPAAVKRALGLDAERSWVILDETNEFIWPGFDLARNAKGEFAYGSLPPAFFRQIRAGVLQAVRDRRIARVRR